MKVLLTGVSGLLGGHILEELINRNVEVKCIVRNTIPSHLVKYKQVDFVKGDVTDAASLKEAIIGCTMLIHAAADTSMLPTVSKKRHEINVNGTQNLIDLALDNNLDRFIFIGTANVFKYGDLDNPGNEEKRTTSTKGMPQYIKTKLIAQDLVEQATIKQGLNAIIVTPCYMLGENDFKPSSGKMVQTIIDEKLPFSSPGGKNVIYVKDVAIAVCNALTMGRIGETYILGNENISYTDLFNKIAFYANAKAPKIQVPKIFIKAYGLLGATRETIFKNEPMVNLPMALTACQKNYYTSEKAVRELKLPQTPLDIVIENTVNWFLEQNKIN